MTTAPVIARSLPGAGESGRASPDRFRWWRVLPAATFHVGCLGVIWLGWSPVAVVAAALLYVARMFAITAFYHRYFSHRTFRTGRVVQFAFAWLGATSAQRGPIWWAAHHRDHHRHSDEPCDIHSPRHRGVLWSHMGWFFTDEGIDTPESSVPDLLKYPELRWLERWHMLAPVSLALLMFVFGAVLESVAPGWGTDRWQMLAWFCVSTTVLHHATFTINSISHVIGRRRYDTGDDSRNNWLLAILTLGEGWHNNHHFHPGSTRQGFFWWEIDLAYYGLWVMSRLGLVRDLRAPGARVYASSARLDRRGGARGRAA